MSTAFLVVTIVGLVTGLVFVVAFHVKTGGQWRRSEVGRWLMLLQCDLVLLFGAIVANRSSQWWREWSGREWVLLTLYATFALQALWPLRLLWRAEPLERKEKV